MGIPGNSREFPGSNFSLPGSENWETGKTRQLQRTRQTRLAIEDFRATRAGQVDLTRGDRVICLDDSDAVWWRGSCRGRVGLFPADAVEPQS